MRTRTWSMGLLLGTGALLALTAGRTSAGPDETPPAEPKPAAAELDTRALAELEIEHSRARDALLAAEARLALLAEKLYDARLEVRYRGELESPFRLAAVEMHLDGELAHRRAFEQAPSAQALALFDGHLPPGRHVVEVRLWARGPDGAPSAVPAYTAAAGLAVHLRARAVTRVEFEAEQDGEAPDAEALRGDRPEATWDVEFHAQSETEPLD